MYFPYYFFIYSDVKSSSLLVLSNMQEENCNPYQPSVIQVPREDTEDDDSNCSTWSEIDNPGQSHLDRLIKRRNRFNLHYHKESVVHIPEKYRIPLLPNEQNYDWIQERKLISIERSYPKKSEFMYKTRLERFQKELDQKVPEISQWEKEWNSLSEEERETRTRNDSLMLLECARRIDVSGRCEAIDRYYAPSEQVKTSERTKPQAGSIANIKEQEEQQQSSVHSTDKGFKESYRQQLSDSNEFYFSDDSKTNYLN